MKTCEICNSKFTGRNKFCSKQCLSFFMKNDNKRKRKISSSMKKYLNENPSLHVWKRNSKFKSKPSEILKQYLTKMSVSFVEEWQPSDHRYFSIDIAFPDKKIGIEINGNQHYNRDGTLTDYYQQRHDFITNLGWKLYEIHYSSCFYPEDVFKNIDIGNQPDYSEYFNLKQNKEKSIKLNRKEFIKIRREKYINKNKIIVENLFKSDINFSIYGWNTKAAKIIGISVQKVSGWMKLNCPDFYNNFCYKRNTKSKGKATNNGTATCS